MKTCFICGEKYDETERVSQEFEKIDGTTIRISQVAYSRKLMAICPRCLRPYVYGFIHARENITGIFCLSFPQNLYEEDQQEQKGGK